MPPHDLLTATRTDFVARHRELPGWDDVEPAGAKNNGPRRWLRNNALALALVVAVLGISTSVAVRSFGASAPHPDSTPGVAAGNDPNIAADHTAPTTSSGSSVCANNPAPRSVVVSLSQQHMWMCQGTSMFGQAPVTTGSADLGNGTPIGSWQVVARESDRYLTGPDYRVFVHYWVPFFGDFGFHDSPWQKFAYGDRELYKKYGSRGCIHVPPDTMPVLYSWALVGTTVTVQA